MGITIPHDKLNSSQTIKLFSNPVPGIICKYKLPIATHALTKGGILKDIKNIRYSRTMMIHALTFWEKQMWTYYQRVKRIYYSLGPGNMDYSGLQQKYEGIVKMKKFVQDECPNHFLFSHRYIQTFKKDKENQGLRVQRKILETKYPDMGKVWFENGTLQPLTCIRDDLTDIEFTIFLNERPYIKRSRIAEVGETKEGNVYVIKK
jgi:hypothetical protein